MLKCGLLGAWFYRYAGILAMDGWLFCFFYCYIRSLNLLYKKEINKSNAPNETMTTVLAIVLN